MQLKITSFISCKLFLTFRAQRKPKHVNKPLQCCQPEPAAGSRGLEEAAAPCSSGSTQVPGRVPSPVQLGTHLQLHLAFWNPFPRPARQSAMCASCMRRTGRPSSAAWGAHSSVRSSGSRSGWGQPATRACGLGLRLGKMVWKSENYNRRTEESHAVLTCIFFPHPSHALVVCFFPWVFLSYNNSMPDFSAFHLMVGCFISAILFLKKLKLKGHSSKDFK